MPWHVTQSDQCPASKPWAVIKDDDGEIEGCHETESAANAQLRALNAAEMSVDRGDVLELDIKIGANDSRHEFRANVQHRTVSGLIVPWDAASGTTRAGRWRFGRGSIYWSDPKRVKLTRDHEDSQLMGRAIELSDRSDGLYGTFLVSRTAAGDEALRLAEDGTLDGFSMEIGVEASRPGPDRISTATRAKLAAVTLTGYPAFDDARIYHVAATLLRQSDTSFSEGARSDWSGWGG